MFFVIFSFLFCVPLGHIIRRAYHPVLLVSLCHPAGLLLPVPLLVWLRRCCQSSFIFFHSGHISLCVITTILYFLGQFLGILQCFLLLLLPHPGRRSLYVLWDCFLLWLSSSCSPPALCIFCYSSSHRVVGLIGASIPALSCFTIALASLSIFLKSCPIGGCIYVYVQVLVFLLIDQGL